MRVSSGAYGLVKQVSSMQLKKLKDMEKFIISGIDSTTPEKPVQVVVEVDKNQWSTVEIQYFDSSSSEHTQTNTIFLGQMLDELGLKEVGQTYSSANRMSAGYIILQYILRELFGDSIVYDIVTITRVQ